MSGQAHDLSPEQIAAHQTPELLLRRRLMGARRMQGGGGGLPHGMETRGPVVIGRRLAT